MKDILFELFDYLNIYLEVYKICLEVFKNIFTRKIQEGHDLLDIINKVKPFVDQPIHLIIIVYHDISN